ncbi:MAG: potassium channel family protein [Roseovarius sp.]
MSYRSFAVVGLGNFGSTVAMELERFGNHVIGVDIDEAKVSRHADKLGEALILDARDDEALREAGLGEVDMALVAVGDNLESSILAAVNLRQVGAGAVWAKATSRTHHRILSRIGVDRVIHPEVEIGQRIAQVMHNPLVRDYVGLGNGYFVVNLKVPESMADTRLSKINHAEKFDLRCVGVMRGTKFIGQDGEDCTLQAGDLLLMLGQRNDLRDFSASL